MSFCMKIRDSFQESHCSGMQELSCYELAGVKSGRAVRLLGRVTTAQLDKTRGRCLRGVWKQQCEETVTTLLKSCNGLTLVPWLAIKKWVLTKICSFSLWQPHSSLPVTTVLSYNLYSMSENVEKFESHHFSPKMTIPTQWQREAHLDK